MLLSIDAILMKNNLRNHCWERNKDFIHGIFNTGFNHQSIVIMTYNKIAIIIYIGVLLLPTGYKILSNILLSRLTPYATEITGVTMWFPNN